MSPFAPRKQHCFRGAKGDNETVISRTIPRDTRKAGSFVSEFVRIVVDKPAHTCSMRSHQTVSPLRRLPSQSSEVVERSRLAPPRRVSVATDHHDSAGMRIKQQQTITTDRHASRIIHDVLLIAVPWFKMSRQSFFLCSQRRLDRRHDFAREHF